MIMMVMMTMMTMVMIMVRPAVTKMKNSHSQVEDADGDDSGDADDNGRAGCTCRLSSFLCQPAGASSAARSLALWGPKMAQQPFDQRGHPFCC